ncbi:Autophagy-related protein 2 [Frankliniella fusca]|uniref:Autophagy-related protein 2 n=1 Tax=Frankliniella fusca TaxID=407009 RepID=A0AAE1H4U3_9NEOP|nr:Autophagy-related protein 2 [Frankliniella fusca]
MSCRVSPPGLEQLYVRATREIFSGNNNNNNNNIGKDFPAVQCAKQDLINSRSGETVVVRASFCVFRLELRHMGRNNNHVRFM